MKTPDMVKENNALLRNAANTLQMGYYNHLANGGKNEPAQERWIEALTAGADAITQVAVLESRLAQVERERDAAVCDLSDACKYCKHISCDDEDENSPCKDCMQRKAGVPFGPMIRTRFEWRGVCEENTKDDSGAHTQ